MAKNRAALNSNPGLSSRGALERQHRQDLSEASEPTPREEDELWEGIYPTSEWDSLRDGSTPVPLNAATSDDAARAALTAAAAARVAAAATIRLSNVVREKALAATREARKDPNWLGTFAAFLATLALLLVVASAHQFVLRLNQQIEQEALVSMANLAPLEVCAGGRREASGSACRSLFAMCANETQAETLLGALAGGKNTLHPLSSFASYASENWDLTAVSAVETLVAGLLECRALESSYLPLELESFLAGERKELWEPLGYGNTTEYVDNLFEAVNSQLAGGQVESQLFLDGVDSGDLNMLRIAVVTGVLSGKQSEILGGLPKGGFVWRLQGKGGVSALWATVRQNRETAACLARSRTSLLAQAGRNREPSSAINDATGNYNASPYSSGSLDSCASRGAALYVIPASCHSYVCRNGVNVAFWGNWANSLAVTKQSFPTQFLGIKGNYDDMYAIYTGAIGTLLEAASAFLASLFLSLVKTAWLPLKLREVWRQWRKGKGGGKGQDKTESKNAHANSQGDFKS
jgi:hypothetical protein